MDDEPLSALLAFIASNDRVCPRPMEWNRLYKLIGGSRTDFQNPWRVVWEPAPPLILAAWGYASDAEKAARLREQVEWAAARGRLEIAANFLRGLPVDGWHHSSPLKPRY